jgi:hypothetical protein
MHRHEWLLGKVMKQAELQSKARTCTDAAVAENMRRRGQCQPRFLASCSLTFDCRVRVSHLAAVASSAECTLDLLTSLQLLQYLLGQRASPHSTQPLLQWSAAPHLPTAVARSRFGQLHPANLKTSRAVLRILTPLLSKLCWTDLMMQSNTRVLI